MIKIPQAIVSQHSWIPADGKLHGTHIGEITDLDGHCHRGGIPCKRLILDDEVSGGSLLKACGADNCQKSKADFFCVSE